MAKRREIRNSTAEFLIFQIEGKEQGVEVYYKDKTVWCTQKAMGMLFDCSTDNIGLHLKNIFASGELEKDSVTEKISATASDGKNYMTQFYNLDAVISVGYRVNSIRATQFRQWATQHLSEYLVKGFTMDDERLKNPDGRPDYFDELLQRIRDIRASEKRFYQKLRDLFKLSSDYEAREKATQMFFAEAQNKLLYAVTGNTAAEIVMQRADETLPNMGLMTWKGSVVRKGDVIIAKNYLVKDEIDKLNRLVMLFLESAELRVKERKDLTLDYWRSNVDALLTFQGQAVLKGNGQVSNGEMEAYAKEVYCRFDERRKKMDAQNADEEDLRFLENLENEIKNKK